MATRMGGVRATRAAILGVRSVKRAWNAAAENPLRMAAAAVPERTAEEALRSIQARSQWGIGVGVQEWERVSFKENDGVGGSKKILQDSDRSDSWRPGKFERKGSFPEQFGKIPDRARHNIEELHDEALNRSGGHENPSKTGDRMSPPAPSRTESSLFALGIY
eukprot:CAMPEP_0198246428 /NCGR_PEP_ID=MMETSP1446-20131203/45971_1 /TAXON_ID=1461542 ORGANISM="Unidentified sp, Strain CCMP2111" /NCGR_SAMPLE_ID=MMETSP1446 /ASSEMBLY_ACC=CAM_ASM_001112 /LENGTH=162 /DNA_ID=CAMNT_0043930749 /DNA_START=41 /DNA_END=529 /DNA_ORIENTATION=+